MSAAIESNAGPWWITGASRGLGRAFALELARRGAALLVSGRDEAALAETADAARKAGAAHVAALALDLAAPGAGRTFHERALAIGGPPFGVIVNAGFAKRGAFLDRPVEEAVAMLRTNFLAAADIMRLAARTMKEARRGVIIDTTSVVAFEPVPSMAVYAATKAALLHLSVALREELRPFGVGVTSLSAGMMSTDFFRTAEIRGRERFVRYGTIMTPEAVARIGIDAALTGRAVAVPGLMNRATVGLVRALPRAIVGGVTRWLTNA